MSTSKNNGNNNHKNKNTKGSKKTSPTKKLSAKEEATKDDDSNKYFTARPGQKPSRRPAAAAKKPVPNSRASAASNSKAKTASKSVGGSALAKDVRKYFGSSRGKKRKRVALWALLAILCVFFLWFFTHKNSFEVYLGDTMVGVLPMSDEITPQSVTQTVVAKLSAQTGSNVKLREDISLTPVHSSRKNINTSDYVFGEVAKVATYDVEGAVIAVDGVDMVTLKSEEEANAVLDQIANQYITEGAELIEKSFVEPVEITKAYVDSGEIMTQEQALGTLNKSVEKTQSYTIQSGDSLGVISGKTGATIESILSANSGMTIDTPLVIGNTINIVVQSPILTVKTVEKLTYTEASEGEDGENGGEKEVTVNVTKINGKETGRTVVDETVITEPTGGSSSPDGQDDQDSEDNQDSQDNQDNQDNQDSQDNQDNQDNQDSQTTEESDPSQDLDIR